MNTVLGDKLRELRRERKISQQKVSYRTHISPVQLSRYENGKTMPNFHNLVKIAKALEVPLEYFLEDEEREFFRKLHAAN